MEKAEVTGLIVKSQKEFQGRRILAEMRDFSRRKSAQKSPKTNCDEKDANDEMGGFEVFGSDGFNSVGIETPENCEGDEDHGGDKDGVVSEEALDSAGEGGLLGKESQNDDVGAGSAGEEEEGDDEASQKSAKRGGDLGEDEFHFGAPFHGDFHFEVAFAVPEGVFQIEETEDDGENGGNCANNLGGGEGGEGRIKSKSHRQI